jgi:chemotaxis receptor (MCP) glutamine deamidase CheD
MILMDTGVTVIGGGLGSTVRVSQYNWLAQNAILCHLMMVISTKKLSKSFQAAKACSNEANILVQHHPTF